MSSEEEKGFKVSDRRTFSKDQKDSTGEPRAEPEEAKEESGEKKPETGSEEQAGQEKTPPIDFSSFLLSLASAVLMHLGAVPDPLTRKQEVNLDLARQTIDVLNILEEKTKGNLTDQEEKIFANVLADLRIRYVNAIKK